MVQMTKEALQRLINSDIVQNTNRAITGAKLNAVLIDMTDSLTFPSTSTVAPDIRRFEIENQATEVAAGTNLSGSKTFLYNVTESDNVSGNLTLRQDDVILVSNIDPKNESVNVTINSITLNAGDSTVFRLEGTDTIGPTAFQKDFTVTALRDRDYVYISAEADNDPSDVNIALATRSQFVSGSQILTVPTFSGNQYLTILQRASEPNLTEIIIDSLNQIDAFTKTDDAITIDTVLFDAYVSTNLLVGSIVSGDRVTLVR